MQLGCSTITFGPQSIDEALSRIADLEFCIVDLAAVPGVFDHVRLVNPPPGQIERIADLVDGYGVAVASLQSVPWAPDSIDDPLELCRRYKIAADVAQAVGARCWIVDANRPDGAGEAGRAAGVERFKWSINMAAELAEARGLKLGVEAPHRWTLAETLPEVLELLEAVDVPQLGIDLDTSHVLNSGATATEVVNLIGHRVIHVALRDAVRDDGRFCTPGDGDFAFDEFFHALSECGYTGDVTLELEPAHVEASAEERVNEARRARAFVEPLISSYFSGECSGY